MPSKLTHVCYSLQNSWKDSLQKEAFPSMETYPWSQHAATRMVWVFFENLLFVRKCQLIKIETFYKKKLAWWIYFEKFWKKVWNWHVPFQHVLSKKLSLVFSVFLAWNDILFYYKLNVKFQLMVKLRTKCFKIIKAKYLHSQAFSCLALATTSAVKLLNL